MASAAEERKPLLEVANIETLYGKISAVRGVSLQVFPGEIVAILGANGAGKSTTLKSVLGLIEDQPEKGMVRVMGEEVTRRDTEDIVRRGVALVPEGREVFGELTVHENLLMGCYARTDKVATARDLERVYSIFPRLAERKKQEAGTMSGGEQQMLAIGRGLMAAPKLLMLDEPSLGLAPILVAEVFKVIKRLRDEGITILLVEQNANLALALADRAYVIESGRIVLSGTADEIRNNDDIKEFYLGKPHEVSVKGTKRYKRKKRWQ
ncbi:MAG: ABC transporter ATP-binding protein [Deltaproteobacteria bacterium]|nr:ABC transporter ATP-binding protein [Deltaproteobacteria bacterium]